MAGSIALSSLCLLALGAAGVQSQTTPYTDPNTGIDFSAFTNEYGYTFGIAVPEDITTDFIGFISANLTAGWAGVSLVNRMQDALLVVTYPDGDDVTASLREASAYASPGMFQGDATLNPIPDGISVNETDFTYTFLCKGCILDDGRTFTPDEEVPVLGWAMSRTAIDEPSNPSAILNFHNNFGFFGANLTMAKSSKFAEWAAMAEEPVTPPTPPGGNGTIPDAPVANETFDYIVAGGGASGIVVAQRMAETGASVLLVERGEASFYAAGGDKTLPWNDTVTAYDVPGMALYLQNYEDAGEAFCSDTPGQAGCILGGGTAVNVMNFIKPPQRDFDDKWPVGWKWDDMSQSAERLYERNPGSIIPSADGEYYDQAAYDVLSEHFASNGWTSVNGLDDPDSKHMTFTHTPQNVLNGLRAGPVRTYLPLAQSKDNFKLKLNTKVMRAVRTNSTITGVEVEKPDGSRLIYNVNKGGKVILSAGAMSTPRILFNSGIGPTEQIEIVKSGTQGVKLPEKSAWINLPVGKIIQDHPIWYLNWNVKGDMADLTSLSKEQFMNPTPEMVDQFAVGTGPMVQANARMEFFTDVTISDGSTRYVQGTCISQANGTVTTILYLTHGLTSAGSLGIAPNGATEFLVEPWMNTPGDREAVEKFLDDHLLAYARKAGSILSWADGPANATGAEVLAAAGPPQSSIHFVGTARVGADDDDQAVVDLDTKVKGTDNLYVVDASIHPDLPTGNTMVITMVVAERAAERILQQQQQQQQGKTKTPPRPHGQHSSAPASGIGGKRRSEIRRRDVDVGLVGAAPATVQMVEKRGAPARAEVPLFRRPIKPMLFHGRIVAAADDDGDDLDDYDFLH